MRTDGRKAGEMRPVRIKPRYLRNAEGSALITIGGTKVICAATVEERVPHFLRGKGSGWVTAEYAMLPRSTQTRSTRESTLGRTSGRTHEIKRLIGRSLRAVTDLQALGERTVWIDCDVVEADGGTRTASITGAFVALCHALEKMRKLGALAEVPVRDHLAAVSAGVVDGRIMLDLNYEEDSRAEVDLNLVITGSGKLVEIQGTAETVPFSWSNLEKMAAMAKRGVRQLISTQRDALGKITIGKSGS